MQFGDLVFAIDDAMPELESVGGKARSIARMRSLGLPVPPAIVIRTAACREYLGSNLLPSGLEDELDRGIAWLEGETGRTFGRGNRPLLLSVRSGAAVSMPGMMDTVLNLGINPAIRQALATETGDAAFADDVHRRFLDLYADVVLKLNLPDSVRITADTLLTAMSEAGVGEVLESPKTQLRMAVEAVFSSWTSRRAKRYRKHHAIADDLGTAVTIQAMVFGNFDGHSGAGVLFSRNPLTGEAIPFGEYLQRAQGEDVVSGKSTPDPLSILNEAMPSVHAQLLQSAQVLEDENDDVQDIEFTVQQGELFLLQTRTAKRAPQAAVRIAVDMVEEERISPAIALSRVTAEQVRTLLGPYLVPGAGDNAQVLARGEPACRGIGIGTVVSDPNDAEAQHACGEDIVLSRATTSPDDLHGMIVSRAILTEQGGTTSHAAVVSRALGVPCVVGCGTDTVTALSGQVVTVDGNEGYVYAGELDQVIPEEPNDPYLRKLAAWASDASPIQVTNDGEIDKNVLDLDTMKGGDDLKLLPELLQGVRSARGGILETDEGVSIALSSGVKTIVTRRPLTVMLAAIHAEAGVVHD